MGPTEGNGRNELRRSESGSLTLGQNDSTRAPATDPMGGATMARPLDPSSIGKLVEQEVQTMLGAAAAEADRISSTAVAVVRKAEAKIAALQLDLDSAIAELRELAERTEATTPPAEAPPMAEPPVPEPQTVSEPTLAAEAPVAEPAHTEPQPGLPPVLTEPPAAMHRLEDPERPELDMPGSDEIVRMLRENLS